MPSLLLLGVVGLLAQLVDGSLGMGYGVTSSTLLLGLGMGPAVASASVHLAELGTNAVSGYSHWRFGNVDWRVVRLVALPGAVGAFLGATLLGALATDAARPWMAALLLVLGAYLLVRYASARGQRRRAGEPGLRLLVPLGLVGGFVDATGGGGWGPVTTPTLLADGRLLPHRVVGTVSAAEFVVTLAASAGFLLALGSAGVQPGIVAALLAGGVVAAPVAAWVVRRLPTRVLGAGVGGLIVLTNSRTVLDALAAAPVARAAWYAAAVAAWAAAAGRAAVLWRRAARDADATPAAAAG